MGVSEREIPNDTPELTGGANEEEPDQIGGATTVYAEEVEEILPADNRDTTISHASNIPVVSAAPEYEGDNQGGIGLNADGQMDGETEVAGASFTGMATSKYMQLQKKYHLGSQLEEIYDEKTQFIMHPAKPVSSYPSKSEILSTLKQLDPGFETRYGFSRVDLVVGEEYYLLSERYMDTLCNYLESEEGLEDGETLEIDNSDMFDKNSSTKLKGKIIDASMKVITVEVWKQLVEWFGGGPETRRRADRDKSIRAIDIRGKTVRAVADTDHTKYRRVYFSATTTVKEFKDTLCDLFDLDPKKCRVHDFYQRKPFAWIDKPADVHMPISQKQILDDQLVFIECADEDGNYLIKYHGRGGFSIQIMNDEVETERLPPVVGAVGLRNVGNTCYMNSILQCLSNLPDFRDFFTSKAFEVDINKDNPLGYEGKVATAFYKLMDKMWSNTGHIVVPHGFKRVISTHKREFEGWEQHDSQEFLSQLLDALHEDLNRIKDKPFTEVPEAKGRPDAIVAAEAYKVRKMRNDSHVNDLFTGLFKSTVTCPDTTCNNVSVTFDPYMILPLPLQTAEKPYHVLSVIYVPMSEREGVRRFEVIAPKHGPMYILRQIIMDKLGLLKTNENMLIDYKNGKVKPLDADGPVQVAEVYSELEPENIGSREVILFRVGTGKSVLGLPMNDSENLSVLTTSTPVLAYEVYHNKRFMDSIYSPDQDWKRDLSFPRPGLSANGRYDDDYGENRYFEDDEGVYGEPDGYKGAPKLNEEQSNGGKEDGETEEAEVIGIKYCPFVQEDVWYGHFMFNEDKQIIRLEVLTLHKIDYATYEQYCLEMQREYGGYMVLEEVGLSKSEFDKYHVFVVEMMADTKERVYPNHFRIRFSYESEFGLRGLYFGNKIQEAPLEEVVTAVENTKAYEEQGKYGELDPETEEKIEKALGKEKNKKEGNGFGSTIRNVFGFGSKKSSQRKSSKNAMTQAMKSEVNNDSDAKKVEEKSVSSDPEETSLKKIADKMKAGDLEKPYLAGKAIFRPLGAAQVHKRRMQKYPNTYHSFQNQGYYMQEEYDESRSAIILSGNVDGNHQYFWGRFQQDQGFTKGEFTIARYESKNWFTHNKLNNDYLLKGKKKLISEWSPEDERELYPLSKFPESKDREDRILVMLAHRCRGYQTQFYSSIPNVFFIPEAYKESDLFDLLKAKFRLLLQQHKMREKALNKKDEEVLAEIEDCLRSMTIWRADQRFRTQMSSRDTSGVGKRLREHEDGLVMRYRNHPILFLVVDWPAVEVPFNKVRGSHMLNKVSSNEEKMKLSKALELFSRTEKLNSMNTWYCRKCKDHKEAYKQLQIWSLPPVLVIQFKRFSQDEGRSVADKLEVPVDFDYDLNMKDFALSYQHIVQQIESKDPKLDMDDLTSKLKEYEYELVAVSSHVGGGLGYGHYVACARNEVNGEWYHYDDERVTLKEAKDKDEVANPMAYVVFYMRKTLLEERRKMQKKTTSEDNKNEIILA